MTVDDAALRQVFSLAAGDAHLPFRDHGGGIVDDEGDAVAGRDANGDRIGAECAQRAAVWGHAAVTAPARAGGHDADAAGLRRLFHVLAQPAEVPVAHQVHAADRRTPGLLDGPLHREARRVVAEAVVAVEEQGAGGLGQYRRLGIHLQAAVFGETQVLRDAEHAMGVVAGEVGVDQDTGYHVGDGARSARGREDPPCNGVQVTRCESMHRSHAEAWGQTRNPGTLPKWPSSVTMVAPNCRQCAAIHTSFMGSGVPAWRRASLVTRELLGGFVGSMGHEHGWLVEKGTEFTPILHISIATAEAVQEFAQNKHRHETPSRPCQALPARPSFRAGTHCMRWCRAGATSRVTTTRRGLRVRDPPAGA